MTGLPGMEVAGDTSCDTSGDAAGDTAGEEHTTAQSVTGSRSPLLAVPSNIA